MTRAEDALQKAYNELERKVEERATELKKEIAARNQAERDLLESEEKFRAIYQSSNVAAIISIDDEGNLATWNPGAEEAFGYSEGEILGRPLTLLIPERYREAHNAGLKRALETGEYRVIGKSLELFGLHKDGHEFPMELSLGAWHSGERTYFSAIINDITKRRRSEEALQESEERYHSLAEASFEGIVIHSKGHIIDANTQFQKMLGYELQELIGMESFALIAPEFRELARQNVIDEIEEPYESLGMRKDSTIFPMQIHIRNMQYRGERVRVAVCQDITKRKRAEVLLMEAKEEAEKANETKSEFIASMSHELRTPLNAVLGFAQMLQFDPKNPLSPAQNVHVDSIISGGEHLLYLVNQILDLAKIEGDQIDISLEELNVSDTVEDCVALMIPLGKDRDIKIIDDLSTKPPVYLLTDRTRFKQVLLNLLSNAIKFNKMGGTVSIDGQETNDGFLHLTITDTGIGITRKDHANVFQVFHRHVKDAKVAQEGTGIGLTVTKQLVERMAGRIGFESEEGVGSNFWIELPLASNEEVIIWSDALRVGVDAIDSDHRTVINLINRVAHQTVDVSELDVIIQAMIDYTIYHFRREEAIMEVSGYPDQEKHCESHRKLIDIVDGMADTWREERNPEVIDDLRKLLRIWWTNHIQKVDTEIAQYTTGKERDILKVLENFE